MSEAIIQGFNLTETYTYDGTEYYFGISWEYTFVFDGVKALCRVALFFDFQDFSAPNYFDDVVAQDELLEEWGQRVADQWNGLYVLKDNETDETYPCELELIRSGVASLEEVFATFPHKPWTRVWEGSGPSAGTNWYINSLFAMPPHETGHWLGLWDEYWRGALNPAHDISDFGLMGYGPLYPTSEMYERYYQPWLNGMLELFPEGSFSLHLASAEEGGGPEIVRTSMHHFQQMRNG